MLSESIGRASMKWKWPARNLAERRPLQDVTSLSAAASSSAANWWRVRQLLTKRPQPATTSAGEKPLKDGADDVLHLLRYASGLSTCSRSTGREAKACSSCPTFPSPSSSERRALGTGAFTNLSTQQQGLGEAAGSGRSDHDASVTVKPRKAQHGASCEEGTAGAAISRGREPGLRSSMHLGVDIPCRKLLNVLG